MSDQKMKSFQHLFISRLDTLSHVLEVSANYFENEADSIFSYGLIDDMLPLGTQIAFACNQPRNFSLWCDGLEMDNLSPDVDTLDKAKSIIEETKANLRTVNTNDTKLQELKRIDLTENQYLELRGLEYVNDFLIPNFYFHLVTAYNIMRMKGAPLGKANYMLHLVPQIRQS